MGNVALSAVGPDTTRGDVRGADLHLVLDEGEFSCRRVMDFAFTLAESP
jgi:hypothetical protein